MSLVREFHEAFDLPVSGAPIIPNAERIALRRKLIREEFEETDAELDRILSRLRAGRYKRALEVYQDLARLAKELSDLRYVVEGTELEFGIPGDNVYRAVHASNMSKLGPDGRPIRRHDGKVLKGPDYFEPDVLLAIGIIIEGDTEQ